MSNILLAYQNRTDTGTLSGGTWLASLPLVNLQNRLVQRVARSNGTTLAATQFDMDFGTARGIGVVALVVHNMSVSAKVRISANTTNTFTSPAYTSDWVNVWPTGMIPQDLLEWEDNNFWLGTLSAEARAGYQSPFIHVPPSPKTYRYWRVEIDDTTNPDGYVHIGRLFMSPAWTPTINYSYGNDLVYKDPTPIETSLSGAEYFDIRERKREFTFSLEGLSHSEAHDYVLQIQRLCGINGEILQIPDQDDTTRIPVRSYVGRLVDLKPIGNPKPDRFKVQITVREF